MVPKVRAVGRGLGHSHTLTPHAFAGWSERLSFSPERSDEAFEGAVPVIRFGLNGQDGLPQEPRRTVGLGASLSFYVSQGESVASHLGGQIAVVAC